MTIEDRNVTSYTRILRGLARATRQSSRDGGSVDHRLSPRFDSRVPHPTTGSSAPTIVSGGGLTTDDAMIPNTRVITVSGASDRFIRRYSLVNATERFTLVISGIPTNKIIELYLVFQGNARTTPTVIVLPNDIVNRVVLEPIVNARSSTIYRLVTANAGVSWHGEKVDAPAVDLTAVTVNILPSRDIESNLGSSAKRWRTLYTFFGIIDRVSITQGLLGAAATPTEYVRLGNALLPGRGAQSVRAAVGSEAEPMPTGVFNRLTAFNTIQLGSSTANLLSISAGILGPLVPSHIASGISRNIGSRSRRWQSLFVQGIDAEGNVNTNDTVVSGTLDVVLATRLGTTEPRVDSLFELGGRRRRWRVGHFDRVDTARFNIDSTSRLTLGSSIPPFSNYRTLQTTTAGQATHAYYLAFFIARRLKDLGLID